MHTMPRLDPRFNALDVIRLFENNLRIADKRLVIAWFFSLIPVEEQEVDVVQVILDLLSVIPVAGRFADLFSISIATAQAAKDIAELFEFSFEEEEVELAKLRTELQDLRDDFRLQRDELLRTQVALDQERERANALLATIELLEDEIRRLEAQTPIMRPPDGLRDAIRAYFREVDRLFRPTGNQLVTEFNAVFREFNLLTGEDL